MSATIRIDSSPNENQPNPVENCINYCFSFLDVINEFGTNATIVIEFLNNEPQTVGDTLIFAGVQFEVNDIINNGNFGSRYINLTNNSAGLNATLFLNSISNHPLFFGVINGTVTLTPTGATVTINWAEIGEINNFTFDFSNLTYPLNYTETNGTFNDYIDGYRLGYKIICLDTPYRDIINLQQIPMNYDSNGNVLPLCIDLHRDLSREVFTTLPNCTTVGMYDENIIKNIALYYGSIQAKESGCGIDFVNWKLSDSIQIINSAWNYELGDITEWYNLYSFNGSNIGEVKFLTSKPSNFSQCLNVCDWLWVNLNMRNYDVPVVSYFAYLRSLDSHGNEIDIFTQNDIEDDGVYIIPVGTANSGLNLNSACEIEITVYVITDITPYIFKYSETYKIRINKNCCESIGVYFLDPKGGYTYLPFDYQEDETYTSNFTEICKDITCNGSYKSKLQGNKFNLNSDLKSEIRLRSRIYQKNDENRQLFKAFKASEYRFIMLNGEPKHMLASSESTKIYQNGEYLELFVTLIDAAEYKVQSGN